ncbi:MAG: nucleotidyltransferase domain-containing protein [Candidatus Margulisiibacteriota bacterium]|jgi:predicted nucleotidyltransferase
MVRFGLSEQTINLIESVVKKYPQIEKTQIIGSRVIGNFQDYSDIDLVFYGNIDQDLHGKVKQELEDLPLPYTFDILIYDKISSKSLIGHIQKYGKNFLQEVKNLF